MPIIARQGQRAVNRERVMEALEVAQHTGRWTELAILGLYCVLYKAQYEIDYEPKDRGEPGWSRALRQIRQCIESVRDVARARWCVWALFSQSMKWFTTKWLEKLADPALCTNTIWSTAVALQHVIEEVVEALEDAVTQECPLSPRMEGKLKDLQNEWKRVRPLHPLIGNKRYEQALEEYEASRELEAKQAREMSPPLSFRR